MDSVHAPRTARRTLALWIHGLVLGFLLSGVAQASVPLRGTQGEPVEKVEPGETTSERPPNIVILFTDDQRHDSLGCTGSPFLPTPHFDRLAREGTVFDNAHVVTSLCCPSRVTLLTGKHAHVHGVSTNRPSADFQQRHRTIAQILGDEGYETAWVGKWHLHNPGAAPRPGFDHWVSFEGQGDYFDQTLNVNGERVETRGFNTDVLLEHASSWIEGRGDRPFLLFLSLKNCHLPFLPPARHRGLLANRAMGLPASFRDPVDSLPGPYRDMALNNRNRGSQANPDLYLDSLRAYWELMPSVDEALGGLLAALEARGDLDRTLVIASSDNGYLIGEHGLTQKQAAYEPSTRVPMLMRLPGAVPAGHRTDALALNLDLARTCLAAAGVDPPRDLQGANLLALLEHGKNAWRRSFLYMAPYNPAFEDRHFAIRTERHKYMRFRGEEIEEALFDLERDPEERVNLAGDPKHDRLLEALRREALRLMKLERVPPAWWDPIPGADGPELEPEVEASPGTEPTESGEVGGRLP